MRTTDPAKRIGVNLTEGRQESWNCAARQPEFSGRTKGACLQVVDGIVTAESRELELVIVEAGAFFVTAVIE
jgi:hypothetical protein